MGSCIKCGRHWTGLAQAHCAATGCHQHFSTVANFDRHRPGGHCQPPGDVHGRDGQPLLKPVVNRFGITWVQNRERPDDIGQDVDAA